jgi:hypothetical protein
MAKNPYSYDCEVIEHPACGLTDSRWIADLDAWCCADCEQWLSL